jgi:large subunit ribosomal protein L4
MPVVNNKKKTINKKEKAVKKDAGLGLEKKGAKFSLSPSLNKEERTPKKETNLEFPVYDSQAKEISKIQLNPQIFGLKINPDLINQAVEAQMSQARIAYAHTKDRGEVRGGGKKPWRQKGTGRARHGSIRSPLWRGGGVTFGPRKEKVFAKNINKKMRRAALLVVLSGKVRDNEMVVLDELKLAQPKTKLMAGMIENFKTIKNDLAKGGLIVMAQKDENIIRASRNIPGFMTIGVSNLNIVDLLKHKYLIMPKEAIGVIEKNFLK